MFQLKHSAQVVRGALLLASALTFGAASSLLSQQAQPATPAPAVAAPVLPSAPAVPAPAASELFAPAAPEAPTIAAAEKTSKATVEEMHTITISTLALVLAIVLLVVLID